MTRMRQAFHLSLLLLFGSAKPLCFPSGLRFTSFASVNDRTRAVGESTLPTSAWQCCKKAKEHPAGIARRGQTADKGADSERKQPLNA